MKSYNKIAVAFVFAFFVAFLSTATLAQDAQIGLKEGFANPPAGFGEVPFWWWTGDKLDVERLNWQIDQLAAKGISGAQVNYAHQDVRNEKQPNWLTYPDEPETLTDEWFDAFEQVAAHCRELNMGIGLSGYTLDWQNSPGNLFDRIIYSDVALQSRNLYVRAKKTIARGTRFADVVQPQDFQSESHDSFVRLVRYRKTSENAIASEDFEILDPNELGDKVANDDSELWFFCANRREHTLNPLHPEAGKTVVERFFQPFETRAKETLKGEDDGKSNLGLNYFFQDELQIGTGDLVWYDDLPEFFYQREGYSYWTAVPAMFNANVGPKAEKYRLDYMNARVKLAEERYFIPIYEWNAKRGRIYACDPGSRGRDPSEFCDYFSAIRWYTAPGHDTPGGRADFIKNKVSSSIAHFYQRPRVWLEGYHSFGWGADPERLLFATNENFLFGANLLNLHGLYYTTYGGYWEWAPPCYHFRQPYWETFGSFLKYFERLSFALTRGVEQTDVVILYPVSPYHANLDGARARDVAFDAASRVYANGLDVLFIDDESVQRSEVRDGKLCLAGSAHGIFVLPSIRGIHWKTLQKALELYRSGGTIVALDALPEASDRAGRDDESLDAVLREIFGVDSRAQKDSLNRNANGGVGVFFSSRVALAEDKKDVKKGTLGTESILREYPGGFAGHWVWSPEVVRTVYFKWVVQGLADEPQNYRARFFCDNAGALYVNGKRFCEAADHNSGWSGVLSLRNGDVVTIDGTDTDANLRRGSAGMFFALSDGEKTLVTAEDFLCAQGELPDDWRTNPNGFEASKLLVKPDVGNVHVLHRTGVNTELGENSRDAVSRDDQGMQARFVNFMRDVPREVFDANSSAPCSVMKRTTDDADIYFVMKGKKNSFLAFRSEGRPEFLDALTGESKEPAFVIRPTNDALRGTSVIQWPYKEDEAGLVVFWKNEQPKTIVSEFELNDGVPVSLTSNDKGVYRARVIGSQGDVALNITTLDGRRRALSGSAPRPRTDKALDGDWNFELLPTLDNRWGDFRLPVAETTLGAEAQRFDVDDSGNFLNDFGRKFWILGPFPKDADLSEIEARLAKTTSINPNDSFEVLGKTYRPKPYSFSWRWGIEANPGRQGYHGLKEKIDSRFIGLGKTQDGHNETVYVEESDGSVYYLWSLIPAEQITRDELANSDAARSIVDVYVSGGAPGAIYVSGRPFESEKTILIANSSQLSPVVLRYDGPGRRACCFVKRADDDSAASRTIQLDGLDSGAFNGLSTGLREETPSIIEGARAPLSTIWFNIPGVLNYDLFGVGIESNRETSDASSTNSSRSQTLSFTAPPGLKTLQIPSYLPFGSITIDGKVPIFEKTSKLISGESFWFGSRDGDAQDLNDPGRIGVERPVYWTVVTLRDRVDRESRVDLTFDVGYGYYDGALFPEPLRLQCEQGVAPLGNWNERGVLVNYSGGARYSKRFELEKALEPNERAVLDLGRVGASCRVRVNGEDVGDFSVARPVDVSRFLRHGENLVEVDVYNTLANFYKNIPSRYKASTNSGLMGPVFIRFESEVELSE